MSAAEFRRHCQDRQDYPDPIDRVAHSTHVLVLLLNGFVAAWCEGGKPPFSLRQVAPWLAPEVDPVKAEQARLDFAIAMCSRNIDADKVKLPTPTGVGVKPRGGP